MKAKFFFITVFAAVDAFLGSFAVGFNSRHALIGDPTIPAPKVETAAPAPKTQTDTNTKPSATKPVDKKDGDKVQSKEPPKDKKGDKSKKGQQPHASADKSKTKGSSDDKAKKADKTKESAKGKSSQKHDK